MQVWPDLSLLLLLIFFLNNHLTKFDLGFPGGILLVVLTEFASEFLACLRVTFTSGAFKTCYKNINLAECREFLRSFWNLAKSEQDSFDSLLCIMSICSKKGLGSFIHVSHSHFKDSDSSLFIFCCFVF